MMTVRIKLYGEAHNDMIYNNVLRIEQTYTMYSLSLDDGTTVKYPVKRIYRIIEEGKC